MEAEYPVLKTNSFIINGSTIFTPANIEKIVRAYIPVALDIRAAYQTYTPAERTTIWSTLYFKKIAERIPEIRAVMNTSGVGYKWRDLIWITCFAINNLANRYNGGDREFPNVYKIWDVASYAQSENEIQIIDLTPEQYAEIERRERAAREAAERANEERIRSEEMDIIVTPITPEADNSLLYVAGGAGVLALLMLL
jgi:hypothetical protein